MSVKKQPDSGTGEISEAANHWIHAFLNSLEDCLAETGLQLGPNSDLTDYHLVAIRAFRLTLLESGMTDDDIRDLIGRVTLEARSATQPLQWNSEMNARRFELIDGDIQGTLTQAEQIELTGLTQLMREHVEAEELLPFKGARDLHRRLREVGSGGSDSAEPDP